MRFVFLCVVVCECFCFLVRLSIVFVMYCVMLYNSCWGVLCLCLCVRVCFLFNVCGVFVNVSDGVVWFACL